MATTVQTRQSRTTAPSIIATPTLPREHDARGIPLIPFATAVGVSGVILI
jgi:hypothetical protein